MPTQRPTFASYPMMRALAAAIRANVPTLLIGNPGEGKTAILESAGTSWNRHVETVIGSIREASDFLGLPIEVDGKVTYAPPAWAYRLNGADSALLFLDELTTSAPSVQRAMLRILQEREVGDITLHDGVSIVAAANPASVAVDGWDLPAPIANRMMHLTWHFDVMNWLTGVVSGFEGYRLPALSDVTVDASAADRARVNSSVSAFLQNAPSLIRKMPTDPVKAGAGWPSPRSWSNAMSVLAYVHPRDEDTMLLVLKGCVGDGAATEYLAWLAVADLYDPLEAMADPNIVEWTKARPDQLFALTTSVTALAITDALPNAWSKALAVLTSCANAGRADLATPGARTLLNRVPTGKTVPVATRDAFSDLLQRTGRFEAAR